MRILGFDATARQRVEAHLGPENDVALLILEKGDSDNPDHDDSYALDPTTLQEVHAASPRSIPWLARGIPPHRGPISLMDQRDQLVWSFEPATTAGAAPLQNRDTSSDVSSARAIDLARTSHALRYVNHDLPKGTVDLGGGNRVLTDTEHAISNELRFLKGDLHIVGWKAEKVDEQTYLVTYTYRQNARPAEDSGWVFEVNLLGAVVRNVLEDQPC